MTLVDEDTNSILTNNAKRAIQGNVAKQVTGPAFNCMSVQLAVGLWFVLDPLDFPGGRRIAARASSGHLVVSRTLMPHVAGG